MGLASGSDPGAQGPSSLRLPRAPCVSPGAGRRGVVKDTQGRDRKRRLGGSHFASAHIRLLRAQLTATGNGFDVGTERDLVGDAQSPAPRNARPRAAGQQAVLAGCPLPFPAASWPRPSPPCPQQLPLPSAAWTVLLRPPTLPTPFPALCGSRVVALGPRSLTLPPSRLPRLLPRDTLLPGTILGQQATWKGMRRPHCSLTFRLSLRSPSVIRHRERTNPHRVSSIGGRFSLHLSPLIAFEWV